MPAAPHPRPHSHPRVRRRLGGSYFLCEWGRKAKLTRQPKPDDEGPEPGTPGSYSYAGASYSYGAGNGNQQPWHRKD